MLVSLGCFVGVMLSSLSGHLSRYGRITIVIQVSAIGGRLGFRTSVLQPLQANLRVRAIHLPCKQRF